MSLKELLSKSIDKRNTSLWESLNSKNNIVLKESFEDNYIINFNQNIITIYIDKNNPNPASFTHELLHIKIKDEGFNVGEILNTQIDKFIELRFISKPLKDHLSNCMEHVKMIDIFTALGFHRKEFLSDYKLKKMTFFELINLRLMWQNQTKIQSQSMDYYIGKFFAIKACPNLKFSYSRALRTFKIISPELYDILDFYWEAWINLNISTAKQECENLTEEFIQKLYSWKILIDKHNIV